MAGNPPRHEIGEHGVLEVRAFAVSAPLVGVLGDVLTLPALYIATLLLGLGVITATVDAVLAGLAVLAIIVGWRSSLEELRRIVRESRGSLAHGLSSKLFLISAAVPRFQE